MIRMYTRVGNVKSNVRMQTIFQIGFTFLGSGALEIRFCRISDGKVNIFCGLKLYLRLLKDNKKFGENGF